MSGERDVEDGGRGKAPEVDEAREQAVPEADTRRAAPWRPDRGSSTLAAAHAPSAHARPDEDDPVPSPAILPDDDDDVVIALLGDPSFVPPPRLRRPPPAPRGWDPAAPEGPWAQAVDAVAHDHPLRARLPHDPGSWTVRHQLGGWLAAVGAPAVRPVAGLPHTAAGLVALADAAPAPREAQTALLDLLPARLDAMALNVALGTPPSPAFLAARPTRGTTELDASQAWWRRLLALPPGQRLHARDRLPPDPRGPTLDAPDQEHAHRQAIAWRGVDLFHANRTLTARITVAVQAVADVGGLDLSALLAAMSAHSDALATRLRDLGAALHRDHPCDGTTAIAALNDAVLDHAASQHYAERVLADATRWPTLDTLTDASVPTDALRRAVEFWLDVHHGRADVRTGCQILARLREEGAPGAAALHARAMRTYVPA